VDTLTDWTARYGHHLPPQALADLHELLNPTMPAVTGAAEGSETATAAYIRLGAGQQGVPLWRNNNGAAYDKSDRLIRYGLGHESAALSARWKSSDYIGILPVVVQPPHVGRKLGVFLAVETKKPGWHLTPGDKRGQAQANFLRTVRGFGGAAGFASGLQDFDRICAQALDGAGNNG